MNTNHRFLSAIQMEYKFVWSYIECAKSHWEYTFEKVACVEILFF